MESDQYPNRDWEVSCSRDFFLRIKDDERFHDLIVLGRIINAMYFCIEKGDYSPKDNSPASSRRNLNSFLFSSSVLYEGLGFAKKLGKNFKNYESFQKGFSILFKEQRTKELEAHILKFIRNKSVFHFNKDIVKRTLQVHDFPYYKFTIGQRGSPIEMYFALSDEIAINSFIEASLSEEEQIIYLRNLMDSTAKTLRAYIDAAQKLMDEVLLYWGWKLIYK